MPDPIAQPGTLTQMGPTVRAPVWPTLPRQSTAPNTWSVIKYYSCGLAAADTDNVLNQEATRNVKFDLPVTVLGWNASVRISDGSGFPAGYDPLACFGVSFSTVGGEKITIESRPASTVCGTGRLPGFTWGGGWPFFPGTNLVVGITPLLAGLADGITLVIDISFPCLQTRIGASNAWEAAIQGKPVGGAI